MIVRPTPLPGVLLIEPRVFPDARGSFVETFHAQRYADAGVPGPFVQDNRSVSRRGTLRGLHAQRARPQGKLVGVVVGEVHDVVVDLRLDSPAYGRWFGVTLRADPYVQLFVPPGFAHGFCVLTETATVDYKVTAPYDPADEVRIAWDDPDLAIDWPVRAPDLSEKDRAAPRLVAAGYPRPLPR